MYFCWLYHKRWSGLGLLPLETTLEKEWIALPRNETLVSTGQTPLLPYLHP